MSNRFKRKGKSKFIMIEGYVKLSAAWKALTPAERNGYIEVKWRYDGTNNGRIGLGCRELGDELNLGRTAANNVLNGLIEKGFIAKAKPSAFHVKNRAVTEWRLTEYRCDVTGELPTKEFMKWGAKKKQQSSQADTQSAQADKPPVKTTENVVHSPLRRTVRPNFRDPQSSQADTYRYTIGGKANEA